MDWHLLALCSAFLAGLTAVLSKIGVEGIPANLATLIRTGVLLIFLGIVIPWRGEWQNPAHFSKRTWVFLTLSGLTTGLSWMCYYRALQLGPASLVASIDKLSLVFAVLLAVLFLRERLNSLQWIGAGFMVLGALLIALKR